MNIRLQKSVLRLASVLLLFPGMAMAHTGVGETTGFLHGLSHPITGVDHLIAMVAVGLWAAQMGGRALWIVPSVFVGVMFLGGIAGITGMAIPFMEGGILVSLLVLGVLLAGAFKFPLLVSSSIVGFFALFHGLAHGAEMPASLGAVSYCIGFIFSTALLHVVGIVSGLTLRRLNLGMLSRYAGGAVALSGIYFAMA